MKIQYLKPGDISRINLQLDARAVITLLGINDIKDTNEGIRFHCPTHGGDARWSLKVNAITNKYCCQNYSCDDRGDLISLYAKTNKISDKTAALELAQHFSIDLESNIRVSQKNITDNTASENKVFNAWSNAKEDVDHPYLKSKKVGACPGLRYGPDEMGNHSVIVPFYNIETGQLQTIQYIHSPIFVGDSGKYYLSGTSPIGAIFYIGDLETFNRFYIAEGIATLLTIWEALQENKNSAFISCGSAKIMSHSIKQLTHKYTNVDFVICLDNDEAGEAVRQSISSLPKIKFVKPNFAGLVKEKKDKDFNDLKSLSDLTLVKLQLTQKNFE